jgi:hypothetical protein
MLAQITIQSGIAAGTSHPIAGRVARVGSDPQSEVCVPTGDIPGHALTLEFRDEQCLVYNRCRESVYIGARVVEPDQILEWPETDILQLGSDTELLLDFALASDEALYAYGDDNGDEPDRESGSPAVSAAAIEAGQPPPSSRKTSKMVGQLCVTLICLVGCVLLLVRDQNRKSGVSSGLQFSELIATSLASDRVSPELIQRLQFAEAQRVRGRDEVAEDEFQAIRDDLIGQLDQSEEDLEKPTAQILRYIQSRLGSDD